MTELNAYLQKAGIDPAEVALCFHRPVERAFARFLPQLLTDETALFEAYQSTHSDRAAKLLAGRKYLASFVGHPDGWSVFAGLFRVAGKWQRPVSEISELPEIQRLYEEFGACSEFFEGVTQSSLWFDLERDEAMAEFLGRLRVDPPAQGSYVRRAEEEAIGIVALTEDLGLNLPVPEWSDLVLLAREVQVLPKAWAAELGTWRGVYLITDERDGARYVGATMGGATLLESWRAHLMKAAEVPGKLSARDPKRFRFSILERVPTERSDEELQALTASWIRRLYSDKFGLNDV